MKLSKAQDAGDWLRPLGLQQPRRVLKRVGKRLNRDLVTALVQPSAQRLDERGRAGGCTGVWQPDLHVRSPYAA